MKQIMNTFLIVIGKDNIISKSSVSLCIKFISQNSYRKKRTIINNKLKWMGQKTCQQNEKPICFLTVFPLIAQTTFYLFPLTSS